MHHGVEINGRQMSMILGAPLFKAEYVVVAIEMPGYGCTKVDKTGGPLTKIGSISPTTSSQSLLSHSASFCANI